MVTRKMISP